MPEENQQPGPQAPGTNAQPNEELPRPVRFEQLENLLKEVGEKQVDPFDDVPLTVSIELGRVAASIREILEWKEGYVVETQKASGLGMEIMVNGRLFGMGEVVVVGETLAIRITELKKPETD